MLPKKIYRRSRKYYPTKRDNYKKYQQADWNWIDIFNEVDKLKLIGIESYIKTIAKKYNIKYNTLRRKYKEWLDNGKLITFVYKEKRGGHNKLFSENEERTLFEYIKEVYIDNNLYFDDDCLKIIAIKKWNMLHSDKKNLFKASSGWIYDFKQKWKLSTLRAKYSKKAISDNNHQLVEFLKICEEINEIIDNKYIFNMDETFWRIINGNLNVLGITGSENRKILTNINIKNGFTAIFIIAADGLFLKPIIIIKGKTERCLAKSGLKDDSIIFRKFSENGWININIMKFVLNELFKITQNNKSILILDKYSIHTSEIIKEESKKLNIRLVYIPSGKTATNQPLDVSINGPIKSIGKKIAKEIFLSNPFSTPTISDSIKSLIESKEKIKKETIINSFTKACNIRKS